MPKSKRCEGYSLSGQPCRRLAIKGHRYCSTHSRASEIGLPPYITVPPNESFWIFMPIGRPSWRIGGSSAGVELRCLSTKHSYILDSFESEGTYGAVYFGHQPQQQRATVALKICKEVYRGAARQKPPLQCDFVKEFYMHSAVRDRVAGAADFVVKMLDSFFIKTGAGFHGCIVMERMEGDLYDLFDALRAARDPIALRIWYQACNFLALALHRLHSCGIYHLDIKAGNILWRRGPVYGTVELRLIDFGLGCYTGGCPLIPCEATGTYVPKEWRVPGGSGEPTFATISDPRELETGEAYAMFVTCYKLRKRLEPTLSARVPAELAEMIRRGMTDDIRVRRTIDTVVFERLTGRILSETVVTTTKPLLI